MIKRLYIHNYRCFDNFDLKIDNESSILILGNNGSGKSSFGSALRVIQQIARGDNRTRQVIKKEDFAFDPNKKPEPGPGTGPLRIELTVVLDGETYDYSVAFEYPDHFKEAKILDESLSVDGQAIYTRKEAEVSLSGGTNFLVDWHVVALPIVQVREFANSVEKFRSWISKAVLISPTPPDISEESKGDSLEPTKRVDNFAEWFNGVLSVYPASYNTIENFLKEVMPDFLDFQNPLVGESSKKIIVRFEREGKIFKTGLSRLSDGEKMFFVTAVLLAVNKHLGPTLCFWDEPDNFVAMSEVGRMMTALRKSFKHSRSGQIFVTSHNPESIRRFSDENTLLLSRRSHLEPTRWRWLSDTNYNGDLINSLIRDDLSDVG